jgi:hypothetical protein
VPLVEVVAEIEFQNRDTVDIWQQSCIWFVHREMAHYRKFKWANGRCYYAITEAAVKVCAVVNTLMNEDGLCDKILEALSAGRRKKPYNTARMW